MAEKYPDFIKSTGYGTGEGLCGWNCYHSFDPFFPGISTPNYTEEELEELNRQENTPVEYNGKTYTKYEATQKQRSLERTLYAKNQTVNLLREGGAGEEAIQNAEVQYRKASHEYAKFSKAMNLPQQRQRVQLKNIGSEKKKSLTSEPNNGIINSNENTEKLSGLNENLNNNNNNNNILSNFKRIQGEHSWEQDVKAVNPLYSTGDDHYTKNCQRCVCAYEMRRRGYDVTAKPRILDGSDKLPYMNSEGFPSVFKNYKLLKIDASTPKGTINKIVDNMTKWGNGSRAIVRVSWSDGSGGHVFIAEQIEGQTKFLEPQSGKLNVSGYFRMIRYDRTYIMKIDDLEITDKIFECCKG